MWSYNDGRCEWQRQGRAERACDTVATRSSVSEKITSVTGTTTAETSRTSGVTNAVSSNVGLFRSTYKM